MGEMFEYELKENKYLSDLNFPGNCSHVDILILKVNVMFSTQKIFSKLISRKRFITNKLERTNRENEKVHPPKVQFDVSLNIYTVYTHQMYRTMLLIAVM